MTADPLTREHYEAVHSLVASSIGQCSSNPTDELEKLIESWPTKAREAAREILDENVFYCDGCGWYCDTDERHVGDLCDDCHDSREDGLTDD